MLTATTVPPSSAQPRLYRTPQHFLVEEGPCGGVCCGTTHALIIRWDEQARYADRVAYAREMVVMLAQTGRDYFDHNLISRIGHPWWRDKQGVSRFFKIGLDEGRRLGHSCKTWEHYVHDYLHTNGWIGLSQMGGPRNKDHWFLTDKSIAWLDSIGFDWRTAGHMPVPYD